MFSATPKVLIVDDEPFNIEIIEEYLEDLPYLLDTAEDGQEAWEKLEADPQSFDAIILDRMMPRMTGLEVLERVRAHPELQSIPVILQTGMAAQEDILEGMQAGAYYYLTKPFEEEMLTSVLTTAIEDRMRYRAAHEQSDVASRTLGMLTCGGFEFKTLEAARDLSTSLANAFPDPRRVVIGLSELLINAVEHGNLGITYDEKSALRENESWDDEVVRRLALPENQDKYVQVRYERKSDVIEVVIKDQGEGFDWEKYIEMDPARAFDTHGRGIAMSKMMSFDELEYRGKGNEVVVKVALNPASN